jgi:hypothetical protein
MENTYAKHQQKLDKSDILIPGRGNLWHPAQVIFHTHMMTSNNRLCLTFCRLCTQSRPEFTMMVEQLRSEYPELLEIVTLECMAACDDVPAIMLETDYYPQVNPLELRELVEAELVQ